MISKQVSNLFTESQEFLKSLILHFMFLNILYAFIFIFQERSNTSGIIITRFFLEVF
jgi:hypothetical protein